LRYLSVCSGIEAASVAWHPLGWTPLAFSEIEPFPRAVLVHHYPDTPLHGDFTVLKDQPWIVNADVLVGGTPCQAFSVAGLRNSLADDRGNLSLEFVRLANAIDDLRRAAGRPESIIVWENVPGVLSVKDNAFGCFLAAVAGEDAALVPTGGRWTDAGVVDGPRRRIAWRILDAQYFGLAQRRRRVFVVASARDGFDPAAVLLEFEGVRRDTPPRREAGQAASGGTTGRAGERSSHWDGDFPHPTLNCSNSGSGGVDTQTALSGYLVAHSLRGEGFDASTQFGDIAGSLTARHDSSPCADRGMNVVVHPVQSEDGTGRGTPLVPVISDAVGFYANEGTHGSGQNVEMSPTLKAHPKTSNLAAVAYRTTGNDGVYETGDLVHALTTATDPNSHVIGFSYKDSGDIQNALRDSQGGGDKPHVLAAVATVTGTDIMPTLTRRCDGSQTGTGNGMPIASIGMAVRRLTPVECERLQGFPDDYTLIPWKKKPAEQCPDGPRYKALGNSMAVPVMRWIGTRIAAALASSQLENAA
jgi:DNA (cytosine-5)-methyltransferase 1